MTNLPNGLPDDDDMLDCIAVGAELGGPSKPLNRATVFRLVKKGLIPPPVKFGPRIARWRRGDIRKCKRAAA